MLQVARFGIKDEHGNYADVQRIVHEHTNSDTFFLPPGTIYFGMHPKEDGRLVIAIEKPVSKETISYKPGPRGRGVEREAEHVMHNRFFGEFTDRQREQYDNDFYEYYKQKHQEVEQEIREGRKPKLYETPYLVMVIKLTRAKGGKFQPLSSSMWKTAAGHEEVTSMDTPVEVPMIPNVYTGGGICWGDHEIENDRRDLHQLDQYWVEFWSSEFNADIWDRHMSLTQYMTEWQRRGAKAVNSYGNMTRFRNTLAIN